MWAKDENEKLILEGVQVDLGSSFTKENLDLVEKTTKRISVDVADNEEKTIAVRNETIDGVEETASVGTVSITDKDAKKSTYYYERVKVSESAEDAKLMELAEKMNKEYDEMDMYSKIQTAEEFYRQYSSIMRNVEWQKVEDLKIQQPETSVAGDKYIVYLKKVAKNGDITFDAQFLTAEEDYKPNVKKEQVVTQETTRLPITYDSIALIVILAVVVIALIVVFIRMKKLNNKNEEK